MPSILAVATGIAHMGRFIGRCSSTMLVNRLDMGFGVQILVPLPGYFLTLLRVLYILCSLLHSPASNPNLVTRWRLLSYLGQGSSSIRCRLIPLRPGFSVTRTHTHEHSEISGYHATIIARRSEAVLCDVML